MIVCISLHTLIKSCAGSHRQERTSRESHPALKGGKAREWCSILNYDITNVKINDTEVLKQQEGLYGFNTKRSEEPHNCNNSVATFSFLFFFTVWEIQN